MINLMCLKKKDHSYLMTIGPLHQAERHRKKGRMYLARYPLCLGKKRRMHQVKSEVIKVRMVKGRMYLARDLMCLEKGRMHRAPKDLTLLGTIPREGGLTYLGTDLTHQVEVHMVKGRMYLARDLMCLEKDRIHRAPKDLTFLGKIPHMGKVCMNLARDTICRTRTPHTHQTTREVTRVPRAKDPTYLVRDLMCLEQNHVHRAPGILMSLGKIPREEGLTYLEKVLMKQVEVRLVKGRMYLARDLIYLVK